MGIINTSDILETIEMITAENLDVRTVTMGISLLDCIDPDPKRACEKIYNKITTKAARLVPVVEDISREYGIPIVNKRISVCLLYTSATIFSWSSAAAASRRWPCLWPSVSARWTMCAPPPPISFCAPTRRTAKCSWMKIRCV